MRNRINTWFLILKSVSSMYSIRQMHISLHQNYRKTQQARNQCVLSTAVHNSPKCHRTAKHSHFCYFLKNHVWANNSHSSDFWSFKTASWSSGKRHLGNSPIAERVRSRKVWVPSETHSRVFSITILINSFLTNVPILYLQWAPENLCSQGL